MYNRIKNNSFLLSFLFLLILFIFPQKILSAESLEIKNFPTSKFSGEEFEVLFDAISLSPSASYYMKGLGGNVGTTLTEVDTWNGGWVQQNGSWISMPVFSSNSEGSASATIKIRFDPNVLSNSKELKIRIRKTDGNDNYDSPAVIMAVNASTPAPTPTQTANPTVTPKPIQTQTPTLKPTLPTKTQTPIPIPSNTPDIIKKDEIEVKIDNESVVFSPDPKLSTLKPEVKGVQISKKTNILVYLFIISGLLCLGYVAYIIYNNKHRKNEEKLNTQ